MKRTLKIIAGVVGGIFAILVLIMSVIMWKVAKEEDEYIDDYYEY